MQVFSPIDASYISYILILVSLEAKLKKSWINSVDFYCDDSYGTILDIVSAPAANPDLKSFMVEIQIFKSSLVSHSYITVPGYPDTRNSVHSVYCTTNEITKVRLQFNRNICTKFFYNFVELFKANL